MTGIDKLASNAMETADFDRFSKINQKTPDNVDAIKKLSDEFEGIFMEIVLKSMRRLLINRSSSMAATASRFFNRCSTQNTPRISRVNGLQA